MGRRAMMAGVIGWMILGGLLVGAAGQPAATEPPVQPGAPGPKAPGADAPGAKAPMTDIHDIKPPERPLSELDWRYAALAGAASVALLVILFWMRRRSKRGKAAAAVPQLSPTQRALTALDELRDVGRFDGRAFYFRLSALLREYLQGRYGIDAPEMTVEELLPRIKDLDVPKDLQGDLRAFFRAAEPVKFAGATAVERQMEADHAFAVAFVRETDPARAAARTEGDVEEEAAA